MGTYLDYTEYDENGNILYASPSMEERAKRPIVCPNCIGSISKKYCGLNHDLDNQQCISCSYFWKKPETLKDWIRYFYVKKIRNPFYYHLSVLKGKYYWWKYLHIQTGSIPSLIKAGDIIEFKYDDEIAKKDPMFEGVKTLEINKLWIGYGNNGYTESGVEDKFYIMASTSMGTSTLNALLDHKTIISINGKTKYVDPEFLIFYPIYKKKKRN